MAITPTPLTLPAPLATQNVRIVPGSPLAVVGLFVELIRTRFDESNGLPWTWRQDIKKTTIAIESQFTDNLEHRNYRPAVFVDKDETTPGRVIIGDRAGQNLHNNKEAFWCLMSCPIVIDCIATKRGESAMIGDLTQVFLHASSDLIQAKFGLHEITPIVLGRTQPFERDENVWVTALSFSVQFNFRWTQAPVAPLLQQIDLHVTQSNAASATEFFERIAIGDTDD